MDDAVIIMREAYERGASHLDLVCAATAAVRALAFPETSEVMLAITAVERWFVDPSRDNLAKIHKAHLVVILMVVSDFQVNSRALSPNGWALFAAAMVCSAYCYKGADDHPAVYAVEYACKAAHAGNVDIAVAVTAALL